MSLAIPSMSEPAVTGDDWLPPGIAYVATVVAVVPRLRLRCGADLRSGNEARAVSATASSPGQVLVATKLHVPAGRPGMVARSELVARLVAGSECKLALLCAPAGWGKTMLLSEWYASEDEERPFAWVSLDPSDDDPVRFWSYVIGAVRTVESELGASALAALPMAGPALVDTVVAPMVNELAALSRPLVLVLDDYHLVRGEAIHDSVAFLLRHLPPSVQVAIASRADPPLPLGSLRAAGEVAEIRAAELRFSDEEADALLNGSLDLGLDQGEVEVLQARTEGWPAGLQLAALSLQAHADRHAFVEAFAGDDRHISDYLHEVLAAQSAPVRAFLLKTSILERMCATLCDAVTGSTDAAGRLDELHRSNLFLVALDGRGHWYRYHHLFRDLLRHELERAEPELLPELHRRASAWHLTHGDASGAIEHATKAGDFADAGELIARHWRPIWTLGHRETVAAWIDALPRDVVLGDPRLCLARGWTALFLGQSAEVEPWVQAAEAGSLPGPLFDGTASVEANVALLRSVQAYFAGHVGHAREHGERALALEPDEASPTRAVSRLVLALPLYFAGELERAERLLAEALRPRPGPDWADVHAGVAAQLAAASFDLGRLAEADRGVTEAEELVRDRRLDELPAVNLVHLVRGKLLEQRGEHGEAAAAFARAVELARRGAAQLELAHALLLLARLERRTGAQGGARVHAREARAVLETCPDPGMLGELLGRTERSLQLTSPPASAPALPVDLELSERELAVLRLLAGELSQREIGAELYVSFNTVKAHTRSIFRKLGVSSRGDAVARARELGLL
jgi:LuxR family maltose regulon positive regulatory protein